MTQSNNNIPLVLPPIIPPPPPIPPINIPFLSGILNNPQSTPFNITPPFVTDIPTMVFAYVSNDENTSDDSTSPTCLELGSEKITLTEFLSLFYPYSGYNFYIDPNNKNKVMISLLNQVYATTTGAYVRFNLFDQLVKIWCAENNKPASSIPPVTLLQLRNEVFLANNFACGIWQYGLAFDAVIQQFIAAGEIEPITNLGLRAINTNEYDNGVLVNLQLQGSFLSKALNVKLQLTKPFLVKLPHFKKGNKYKDFSSVTNNLPISQLSSQVYNNFNNLNSNMQKLSNERSSLDDDDDNYTLKSEDLSEFKKQNINNYEYSINNVSEEKTVFTEISKIVNNNTDDDNSIGQGSFGNESKW
jgi:hypothetical protein